MKEFWQDFRRALFGFVVASLLMLIWSVFSQAEERSEPWRFKTADVHQLHRAIANLEAGSRNSSAGVAGDSVTMIPLIPQAVLFV
jgi:hypothetical protein